MTARALAIGIDFAARAAASVLVALPLVSAVASSGIGRFPANDRQLFEPGGLVLSEVIRLLVPELSPVFSASLSLFVAFGVLLVIPHAAVLVLLAEPERPNARVWWGRAFASVPALLLITGMALLAQLLVLAFASALGQAARASLANATPWLADGSLLALLGLGLIAALGLGIVRDFGRAAAVRHGLDGRTALAEGLAALRRRPLAALRAFVFAAAGSCFLVALAAFLSGALDVSRAEGYRFALVVLIHQTAAAGVALFRIRWFGATLALNAAPAPAQDS